MSLWKYQVDDGSFAMYACQYDNLVIGVLGGVYGEIILRWQYCCSFQSYEVNPFVIYCPAQH